MEKERTRPGFTTTSRPVEFFIFKDRDRQKLEEVISKKNKERVTVVAQNQEKEEAIARVNDKELVMRISNLVTYFKIYREIEVTELTSAGALKALEDYIKRVEKFQTYINNVDDKVKKLLFYVASGKQSGLVSNKNNVNAASIDPILDELKLTLDRATEASIVAPMLYKAATGARPKETRNELCLGLAGLLRGQGFDLSKSSGGILAKVLKIVLQATDDANEDGKWHKESKFDSTKIIDKVWPMIEQTKPVNVYPYFAAK